MGGIVNVERSTDFMNNIVHSEVVRTNHCADGSILVTILDYMDGTQKIYIHTKDTGTYRCKLTVVPENHVNVGMAIVINHNNRTVWITANDKAGNEVVLEFEQETNSSAWTCRNRQINEL